MIDSSAPAPGNNSALLLAGGMGSRMGEATPDKVLHPIHGKPVVRHVLDGFAASGVIRDFVVVYRDELQRRDLEKAIASTPSFESQRFFWTAGGAERQNSVYNGLQLVPDDSTLVFIHDCVRPLVRPEIVTELARLAREVGAACLARRVTDTIKRVESADGMPWRTRLTDVDRDRLWATETPQVFQRALILEAYEAVRAGHHRITDDVAAVSLLGKRITLLENPYPNPKLTTPADLDHIACLLK